MSYKLIIASVKPEYSDKTVDEAKAAGATGATVITARGTGAQEAKTFFGLTLEAQTDIILFLVDEDRVQTILEAIGVAGKFEQPGTGIAFVMPVENVIGMESQIGKLQK